MTQQPTLKVLLTAIDVYADPRMNLGGCKNDIQHFQQFLKQWVDTSTYHLDMIKLSDAAVTYENLTETFLKHFGTLKDGDAALFYYSGHGSQIPAPEIFWFNNPQRKMESLVLHDSRTSDGKDLVDKELGWLLWQVTQDKEVDFTVILDSCHSGSGTRLEGEKVRLIDAKASIRERDTLLGVDDYVVRADDVFAPPSNHLLLAACQDFETAKERSIQGERRGIFSFSLLEALQGSNGRLSFAELMTRTQNQVNRLTYQQHPQLEVNGAANRQQLFLARALAEKKPYSIVTYDKKLGWVVEAGTLHGIPTATQPTTTEWEVYPIDGKESLGVIKAQRVFASRAKVEGIKGQDINQQYRAVLTKMATNRLKIAFSIDLATTDKNLIRENLAITAALQLEVVGEESAADYVVQGNQQQWWAVTPTSDIPAFHPLGKTTDEAKAVQQLLRYLKTIARWQQVKNLSNPFSQISLSDVSLEFYRVLATTSDTLSVSKEELVPDFLNQTVELAYRKNPLLESQWQHPIFRLKIKNTATTRRTYYISVLFLGSDFSIDTSLLHNQRLAYNEEIWLFDQEYHSSLIYLHLEKEWKTWGIREVIEHFKIIISTELISPELFEQAGLPLADKHKLTESRLTESRGKGRSVGFDRVDSNDWNCIDFGIRVIDKQI